MRSFAFMLGAVDKPTRDQLALGQSESKNSLRQLLFVQVQAYELPVSNAFAKTLGAGSRIRRQRCARHIQPWEVVIPMGVHIGDRDDWLSDLHRRSQI